MYDELAEHYHLRYRDWEASIASQASVLAPILERAAGCERPRTLDCACGVGTQSLGLAALGFPVVGSDLSAPALARARREAAARRLEIELHEADMRDLSSVPGAGFDAVLAADNALPHLMTDVDLRQALGSIREKLRPGGALVASIRDYDKLREERPTVEPPSFFAAADGARRFSHQVWEWTAEDRYRLHMYMTVEEEGDWRTLHFVSEYRALLRAELEAALAAAGFGEAEWIEAGRIEVGRIEAGQAGFYQPIMIARRL